MSEFPGKAGVIEMTGRGPPGEKPATLPRSPCLGGAGIWQSYGGHPLAVPAGGNCPARPLPPRRRLPLVLSEGPYRRRRSVGNDPHGAIGKLESGRHIIIPVAPLVGKSHGAHLHRQRAAEKNEKIDEVAHLADDPPPPSAGGRGPNGPGGCSPH